jgi:hypothetical protein
LVSVLDGVIRKARRITGDPVLRRWLVGRVLGRYAGEPAFTPHQPPYLDDQLPLGRESPAPPVPFSALPDEPPERPIEFDLAGTRVTVEPGNEGEVFERHFDDREVELALHRFAWLPSIGNEIDPAWVQVLWSAWCARFTQPKDGWAWHPYTTAERAANILSFAGSRGLPGPLDDTLALLNEHGLAIAKRLEFFGDHHTSNHLANNGRGLFLLGLALGLPKATDLGGRILCHEAARLFGGSGILREASSHYHILLAKQYAECWFTARRHGRSETADLATVTARALAVIPNLVLGGGMPLIGDISPDIAPDALGNLTAHGTWRAGLDEGDRKALNELATSVPAPDEAALVEDGWLRADFASWSCLWHLAPGGWCPMPGHGHQDAGAFELHHDATPVFVDPGRGAYGDTGDAAFYASARAHNTVLIDDADPYVPNRPYYDDAFRRAVGGPAPLMERLPDGVRTVHHGYGRLAGLGAVERQWRFATAGFAIDDRVDGSGRHFVRRLLHTPLAATRDGDAVVLDGNGTQFRITADASLDIRSVTRWTAYGRGEPATAIDAAIETQLPWSGSLKVEVV